MRKISRLGSEARLGWTLVAPALTLPAVLRRLGLAQSDARRRETDEAKRKPIYAEVQRIVAHDLPYINLWYMDNVLVHSRRVRNLKLSPSGNYDFLKRAELAP